MELDYALSLITSRVINRRLKREFVDLLSLYDIINLEYTNKEELSLTIKKKGDTKISFCFIIPNTYPFTPPTIKINNKSYFDYLNLKTVKFNAVVKYLKGYNCLCCQSLLCRDHWSPAYTLKKLLDEFEEYKLLKISIIKKILTDKIKEKYLIQDIDLDSWLFIIEKPYTFIPK